MDSNRDMDTDNDSDTSKDTVTKNEWTWKLLIFAKDPWWKQWHEVHTITETALQAMC
jgi:hypothetical protein